ncbi:MAG: hypothetical protein HUK40_07035 [Desulfobacter sp.]|nr:hypothetical protein [Desulfobacter sp.]
MRLAYFQGCKILFDLNSYGKAVERLMAHLGVTLVTLDFNCCGNRARGKNLAASVHAAVRNIALAQARGLDIFTPCKCCFGQLKHGLFWYAENKMIREKVDLALAEEGLKFEAAPLIQDPGTGILEKRTVRIRHLLDFLFHDIGPRVLASRITPVSDPVKVVLQQGCHALRPFSVTQFDNPFAPRMFRQLAKTAGLDPLDWEKEVECCGSPAAETNKALALQICRQKLSSAQNAGADYICTACTHCQIQYAMGYTPKKDVRPVPFAVFLGAALGIQSRLFHTDQWPNI